MIYAVLHFVARRTEFAIEFLFSIAVLNAGFISAMNVSWLKLAYFPFIISVAAVYSLRTIIPVALLIPLLDLKKYISQENLAAEAAFAFFLIVTALTASAILSRFRTEKEKAVSSLKTIKEKALDISHETSMESLSSDKVISHYFASMMRTDEELQDLLVTIKGALYADAANLFTPHGDSFVLRCSTEGKGDVIIASRGILYDCMKNKKTFYSGEINEKSSDLGYMKNAKISSVIAVPVMDAATPLGVLTVDSSRYQAFSEPERKTAEMFQGHIVRILQRERIYPKLERDYNGLKILNSESSRLVSSLNIDVIARNLCEGAGKIAASQVFFFLSAGKEFELIHHTENIDETRRQFDLKGTFINMGTENKEPLYMSDVSDYKGPVLPFRTGTVRSVIVIPMRYENKLLGLLSMLSSKKDFLDMFQVEILKVMSNQAATSIANARLHAEIEKLATTDGLTGLYNHRMFQEKLTEELKRLNRYSEPSSLMLTDIDYFKKINDSYGHPVGDLVLRNVAGIISETIRDIDIGARYGGEEFSVILPRTDAEGARKIAERLRKNVMNKTFSSDGISFKITISIGIAVSPTDAKNKEELIERADQALYHAKHNGRNQTVLWSNIK